MTYLRDKPFGRRRTDRVLCADEQQHLEQIRRDVDQDPTGMIRRYLRLSQKLLEFEENEDHRVQRGPSLSIKAIRHAA